MPRLSETATSKKNQLVEARLQKAAQVPVPDSADVLLTKAEVRIAKLESLLSTEKQRSAKFLQTLEIEKNHYEAEKTRCAQLSSALDAERKHSACLSLAFDAEMEHSRRNYQALRVERRARQRGQKRKAVLEQQIRELKAVDVLRYDELKKVTQNASKTIDALLRLEKENSSLQRKAMEAWEMCREEIAQSQKKAKEAVEKFKASQLVARRLQKQCERAAGLKEKAVQRAKEQVRRERSVHNLLHKGIYTQDT
jgi:hypothetical protein